MNPLSNVLKHDICWIEEEYEKLRRLPCTTGLPIPPKAFFPREPEKKLPACIVLHLYDFNLREWFKQENRSLTELFEVAQQIATGLKKLHVKQRMTHGDLWMSNVMIDVKKKRADMIDFGLSLLAPCDPYDEISSFFTDECQREVNRVVRWLNESFHICLAEMPNRCPDEVYASLQDAFQQRTATDFLDAIRRAHEVFLDKKNS